MPTPRLAPVPDIVNPTRVMPYIDRAVVWIKRPLRKHEHTRLQRHCAGRLDARLSWFPGRQRLQFNQPRAEAFEQIVAIRRDTHLSFLEAALDWSFASARDTQAMMEMLSLHFRKKYHRTQEMKFYRT